VVSSGTGKDLEENADPRLNSSSASSNETKPAFLELYDRHRAVRVLVPGAYDGAVALAEDLTQGYLWRF